MRRVRFRKDTIFRIYLLLFVVLSAIGIWFCLSQQSRYHARRVDELSARLVELESRLSQTIQVSASVADDSPSLNPLQAKIKAQREELFWVEGNGSNGKYAYMDLVFRDGYRARYYFRPWPSRGELVALHRRIQHDAIDHYWDPAVDDEV